jgi:hypothetical protein
MNRIVTLLAFLVLPADVWAKTFSRPIPQAQSATAEFWFFVASLALVAALIAVNWLVARR